MIKNIKQLKLQKKIIIGIIEDIKDTIIKYEKKQNELENELINIEKLLITTKKDK